MWANTGATITAANPNARSASTIALPCSLPNDFFMFIIPPNLAIRAEAWPPSGIPSPYHHTGTKIPGSIGS